MKNKFIHIIAFLLAFSVFLFPLSVSASGNVNEFLVFNGTQSASDTVKNNLTLNPTYNSGCIFCKYYTGFSTYFFLCDLNSWYHETGSNGWNYYSNYNNSGSLVGAGDEYSGDASSRNYDFSNISNNVTARYVIGFNGSDFIICYVKYALTSGLSLESICQSSDNNDAYNDRLPAKRPSLNYAVVYPLPVSYNPVVTVDSPLSLNVNVDGFYNWLVDTHKDSNFVSYFNLRVLPQYLQFYSAWGSAPQKYLTFYNIDFGDTLGDHLSNTQIIALKNLTDRLYREYLDSLKYPSADFPARDRVTVRRDIDTTTTDNNTVLITDDNDDTIIVSILRDLLRGIIAIRNQIFVTGTDLLTGLDQLDFTVNVANNGGNFVGTDLSVLYEYTSTDFADDIQTFEDNIEEIQNIPQGYIDAINQNELMPENMLADKSSLTVNVPCITGFTIGNNGSTYSTQTGNFTLNSSDYPWLDPIVQKIKRFGSILLIIGYLVHLRYRIPELVRGE